MKSLEKEIPQGVSNRGKIKIYRWKSILLLLALGAGLGAVRAQNTDDMYANRQVNVTDESLMKAIAPYDEDIRNDILTATQYPDVLQKASQIRDNTSRAFQRTIQDYPQKKQNWFYEVSRYPDLMDKLASMPRRTSKSEIEAMLPASATPELKEAAWKLYDNHQNDLIKVASLNQDATIAFQNLIRPLGPTARNAFKSLEQMPDVLSLLNDHIDITARIGERYQNDPASVNRQLADIRDQLDDQNKQDQAAYRDQLAQDPQALQELDRASQDYASTGGYSYPAPTGDRVVNYGSPYSYWFGYPSWYGSPMWYPGAFGYGAGIYLGLGGYSSFYGFPSYGFSRWFYGGAYRYYPNLYRRYDYIYRNRIAGGRYNYYPNRSMYQGSTGRYYNPRISGGSSGFNNNQAYRQQTPTQSYRVAPRNYSYNNRSNSGSYSRPSYGGSSFGGRSGGFSGGGGFHGGGGRGGRR
jgi:hypothetical protein